MTRTFPSTLSHPQLSQVIKESFKYSLNDQFRRIVVRNWKQERLAIELHFCMTGSRGKVGSFQGTILSIWRRLEWRHRFNGAKENDGDFGTSENASAVEENDQTGRHDRVGNNHIQVKMMTTLTLAKTIRLPWFAKTISKNLLTQFEHANNRKNTFSRYPCFFFLENYSFYIIKTYYSLSFRYGNLLIKVINKT